MDIPLRQAEDMADRSRASKSSLPPRREKNRRGFTSPQVEAAANSMRPLNPPEKTKLDRDSGKLSGPVPRGKERVYSVNRLMTKALVGKGGGGLIGREKDVKAGSKKATRLKKREEKYGKTYGTLAPYKKDK